MRQATRPTYLRFGKADRGDIHTAVPQVPIGDLLRVRTGNADYGLIATGASVVDAVRIAEQLGGISVWSVPSIAPLNTEQLLQCARGMRRVFTIEEHSINGGLGSAVAEILSEFSTVQVTRFGITGKFSEQCGSYDFLLRYHGLGAEELTMQISKLMREGS